MNINISYLLIIVAFASTLEGMEKKFQPPRSEAISIPGTELKERRIASAEVLSLPWEVAAKASRFGYSESLRRSDERELMPQSLQMFVDNKDAKDRSAETNNLTSYAIEEKKIDLKLLSLAGGALLGAKFIPKKTPASSQLPRRQRREMPDDFSRTSIPQMPEGCLEFKNSEGCEKPLTRTSISDSEDREFYNLNEFSDNEKQTSSEDEIEWNPIEE